MEEAARAFSDIHMTDSLTYDKIWEQRTFSNMLCVEESQNEHWTADRMVCLGDAVHKMTPNLGAGGNAAIESATALANSIAKLTSTDPSLDEIRAALKAFYEKRHPRVNATCDTANQLTRIEALANWPFKMMALHAIPVLGDFLSDLTCDALVGAEILESLPVPQRSLDATWGFDPESGIGKKESKLIRALYALPLLFIAYGCHQSMGATIGSLVGAVTEPGTIDLGAGIIAPLVSKFFGIASLDNFISKYVAFFTPAIGGFDPVGRMQAIAFLGDLIPIQTIWMIESIRRGNFVTVAHLLYVLVSFAHSLLKPQRKLTTS